MMTSFEFDTGAQTPRPLTRREAWLAVGVALFVLGALLLGPRAADTGATTPARCASTAPARAAGAGTAPAVCAETTPSTGAR